MSQSCPVTADVLGTPEVGCQWIRGSGYFGPQFVRHVENRRIKPKMLAECGQAEQRQLMKTMIGQFDQGASMIDDMPKPAESITEFRKV